MKGFMRASAKNRLFEKSRTQLISRLLDEGFQIVLLTHSEQFARSISHFHFRRMGYATLKTRFSKRHGCQVDEGNRLMPERLKRAERLGEEGRLEDAWRLVRLSIERLYTLAMIKANQRFDPESWRDATAEHMWKNGAGEAIEAILGEESGAKLRDILKLTASGAHDKVAKSQTDLNDAIDYLRGLLAPLRIGG